MRVTNTMMMDKFQNSLSDSLERIDDTASQISTEKKFTDGWTDPVAAVKAIRAQHSLDTVDIYSTSCQEMNSLMTSSETATRTVNSIMTGVNELLVSAANGTNSTSSDSSNAIALGSYQRELLGTLNSSFNGRYIYGGSTTGKAPFKAGTTAEDGAANNGKLMYYDQKTDAYIAVSGASGINVSNKDSYNLTMPVDLGMGAKLSGGAAVNGSVFEGATSALDFLCVKDKNGNYTNVYDELGTAVTTLQSGSTAVDTCMDVASTTQTSVLNVTAQIGEKSNMLTFLGSQYTNDDENITERIANLVDTDVTLAYINYQKDQSVYNACLNIGSSALQKSLVDFLK